MNNRMTEKCPANNVPPEVKDTMWYFLMQGGQKANIPALKEAVNDLCSMMTQMTGGQEKYSRKTDIPLADMDMIMWTIVMEATALVLSGELDKLNDGQGSSELCAEDWSKVK